MLKKLTGTKKPQAIWTTGNNWIDLEMADELLKIAKDDFYEDAEIGLLNDEELRVAVYAIIEALPKRLRKKVTDEAFFDIACVLVMQRAVSAYKIGLAHGNQK